MKAAALRHELEVLRAQVSQSNTELRCSIEHFSRALEQGHAVVYRRFFDPAVYEYMGDYIEAITGYNARDLTPSLWDSLIITAELNEPLAGLTVDEASRRIRTGAADRWQADVQIRTRSGQSRWVMDLSTVLRDAAGRCYGCLGILQDITERKLAEQELTRTSAALREKMAQLEADLALAAELQAALLPRRFPSFPHGVEPARSALRFCQRYRPSGVVGGDFFDVMALSDSKAGVFVCDVMGHGVRSALVSGMIRALMEELTAVADDPGLLLGRINNGLLTILQRAQQPMFATAFYLVADVASGELRFASAGHPSPLHLRRNGMVEQILPVGRAGGPALGLFAESAYPVTHLQMAPEDVLLLFTDGLFEVEDPHDEQFGKQRLIDTVARHCRQPLPRLLDNVLTEVARFAGGKPFPDDVCLLAMEISKHGGSDS